MISARNDRCERERNVEKILFGVLVILYSCLMFVMFYRQTIEYQGNYYSDMKAYIQETQGLESGYEFPYRLFSGYPESGRFSCLRRQRWLLPSHC